MADDKPFSSSQLGWRWEREVNGEEKGKGGCRKKMEANKHDEMNVNKHELALCYCQPQ